MMNMNPQQPPHGDEPVELTYAGDDCASPSSSRARASLVLGILAVGLSLVPELLGMLIPIVLGLLALAGGISALARTRRHPRRYAGRRAAIAAIVLGAIALSIFPVQAMRELAGAQRSYLQSACAGHLKAIGKAIEAYVQGEPDGAFPDDLKRLIDAGSLTTKDLHCPNVSGARQCYYYIPGYSRSSDPDSVIVYEAINNHERGGSVLLQDGHVLFLWPDHLRKVIAANKDRAK